MTVRADVGLHVFWPDLRIDRDPRYPQTPEEQQKQIDARQRHLQDTFDSARAYQKGLEAGGKRTGGRASGRDAAGAERRHARLRARGGHPPDRGGGALGGHSERLKPVIVGGQDAWRVTDLLKQHDVPVIVSPVNALPLRRWEAYDTAYANAGKLQAAGVRFCICQRRF